LEELRKIATDDRPENCEGVLGYEEDAPGDGIIGEFYDNEDFEGVAVKEEQENIDFDW